jgi:hypothetical protein
LNKQYELRSGLTYNDAATIPDRKLLASTKLVHFNKIDLKIAVRDMSDLSEAYLDLQTL